VYLFVFVLFNSLCSDFLVCMCSIAVADLRMGGKQRESLLLLLLSIPT
jgi:hypothetical protein